MELTRLGGVCWEFGESLSCEGELRLVSVEFVKGEKWEFGEYVKFELFR